MKTAVLKKQTTSLFQDIIENPVSVFLFMAFSVILTYAFRNPALTFFGSIFLLFIFMEALSEYILITFGISCYLLAIFSHTFGFDLREQLFLYATLFFGMAFLVKLIRLLSGIKKMSDVMVEMPPFPHISFWVQESVEALFTLALAIAESPSKIPVDNLPVEQKASLAIAAKDLSLEKEKAEKQESIPQQEIVKKESTGYKTVRIDGSLGTPVLDLAAVSKTKPKFFEPPAKKPLSAKFILVTLIVFVSINAIVFWQREKIVGRIGMLLGQKPPITSTPSYVTPLPESSSSTSDVSSLQKDFENINFNPDSITPIFTVAVTPDLKTPTIALTSAVVQPTNPPLSGPTEPPLAIDINKTITVALLNGSGIEEEGYYVEQQIMERNNFYVKSIDSSALSNETIIYYKSGQKAYADKAASVLNSRYNVTSQQTLTNSYFADLKILIGKRK